LKNQAEQDESQGKTNDAFQKIRQAESIYPQLPGLRDLAVKLQKASPMRLIVGVSDVPEKLSPALATTDAEKQAIEMIFEGLIRITPFFDAEAGQCGEEISPGLAADMPTPIPLGRLFEIAREARWSDGKLVTAADVRRTVELLCKWKGRDLEWSTQLGDGKGARIEGDGFHIGLNLDHGALDPLSLMAFKILPELVKSAADPDFAKSPVGSGPFICQGREEKSCLFVANPYYEARPGKEGLPRIREVQFVRS